MNYLTRKRKNHKQVNDNIQVNLPLVIDPHAKNYYYGDKQDKCYAYFDRFSS